MAEATEQEMREEKAPTFATADELRDYIAALTEREHDYGTCVYAMSLAAVAAFNHVASKLGVTGFQASCADMDILRRTRRMERFMILNFEDALYPQYDLHGELNAALREARPWMAEQARERLADDHTGAHPDVIAHWQRLADLEVSQ